VSEDSAVAIDDEGLDATAVPAPTNGSATNGSAVNGGLASVAHVALPDGVSQVDFDAALAAGREKGQLTQDELIDALHAVELTPEVLTTLIHRVTAEGVVLVEEDVEELNSEFTAPRKAARGGWRARMRERGSTQPARVGAPSSARAIADHSGLRASDASSGCPRLGRPSARANGGLSSHV